jgi:hypothetical protein
MASITALDTLSLTAGQNINVTGQTSVLAVTC